MYLGSPLCYLLSAFNLLTKPFNRKPNKLEKVLFIQISEMGSAVSVASSIMELKKRHPKAEIHYLMFKEMSEIVEVMGLIKKENIHTITNKSFFAMTIDVLKAILKLKKKRFDVIIDLELFSRFSSILSYLIGAKDIIGFNKFYMEGLYRGNFQTKRMLYNHTKHIALNFLACVNAIDEPRTDVPLLKKKLELKDLYPPVISSDKDSRENIIKKLKEINPEFDETKKIIILNPNGSMLMPLRRWPLRNYTELARRIIKNTDAYLVLTGTKQEEKDTKAISQTVNNKRCIDLTGRTTIKELIDLYNISDILVSNDSGPPNFAALTKIKVIVLFGPETPICYLQRSRNIKLVYSDLICSPCVSAYNHRKSPCNDNKCMKAIKVDEIYGLLEEML
tara:strand:+ start:247 stop:1422 length:1176 start_codon:yes stop_codon:yes gene_type:complete